MKVLFILPSYQNGGTTTCLRNIVSRIPKEKLDIEVFAITDAGPNRDYISQFCTILSANGRPAPKTMFSASQPSKKQSLVRRVAFVVKSLKKNLEKIGIDISSIIFKRVAKSLEVNNYDVVVAYQEGIASRLGSYFKRTPIVAWIHCDYKRYAEMNNLHEAPRYSKFKKIVCVSEFTKQQFLAVHPQFADKTYALHNIVNDEMVIERSKEDYQVPFDNSKFTLVSVGRMAEVKRFYFIPEIAAKLRRLGVDFKWYVLGGGNPVEEKKIADNIDKHEVKDLVIPVGEVNNPYPYIANADLLVSTSSSEACPCVFSEAFVLHTPVMSADFCSAFEFINQGENGWIAPIDEMAEKLAYIFKNRDRIKYVNDCLASYHFNNEFLIQKFYDIISV